MALPETDRSINPADTLKRVSTISIQHPDQVSGNNWKVSVHNPVKKKYVPPEVEVDNALAMYKKDILGFKVLSFEEEQILGFAIQRGYDARKELINSRLSNTSKKQMSPEYKNQIIEQIKKGNEATQHLIESNIKLVKSVAKRFLNRGSPLTDLINEGIIGLMKAIKKYDPKMGFKFSTYATWWIRQAIQEAIGENSQIEIRMQSKVARKHQLENQLGQRLERLPTKEEIQKEGNYSNAQMNHFQDVSNFDADSLNEVVGEKIKVEFGETIEDNLQPNVDEVVQQHILREVVEAAMSIYLSPREIEILNLRYGLDGSLERPTYEEIGVKFGLKRQGIQQIEAACMKRLRKKVPALRKHFDELVGN